MATDTRKYRADIIDDMVRRGPAYDMFYAIYLAEAVSEAMNRDIEKMDQIGLRFRPSVNYGRISKDIESVEVAVTYKLTTTSILALQSAVPAAILAALERLKDQGPFEKESFYDLLSEVLPEDSDHTMREIVLDAAALPSFSFVFGEPALYGPESPFPRCYHQEVPYQQQERGAGFVPLQNFLDMFNNRIYWHDYQAWKKYRLHLQLAAQPKNKALRSVFSFSGLLRGFIPSTADALAPRKTLNEEVAHLPLRMLGLVGVFGRRVRNRGGLIAVLQIFFPGCKFDVEEFVPKRQKLSAIPAIGRSKDRDPMRLGKSHNSVLGRFVVDYTSMIRIAIGPISFDKYEAFVEGGKSLIVLQELLALYLPDDIEYALVYDLNTASFPPMALSGTKTRLGTSLWLGKPAADVVRVAHRPMQVTT